MRPLNQVSIFPVCTAPREQFNRERCETHDSTSCTDPCNICNEMILSVSYSDVELLDLATLSLYQSYKPILFISVIGSIWHHKFATWIAVFIWKPNYPIHFSQLHCVYESSPCYHEVSQLLCIFASLWYLRKHRTWIDLFLSNHHHISMTSVLIGVFTRR